MNKYIVGIGLAGQVLFTGRVLVQWIASERARSSVIPPSYWLMSLVGSGLLLAYACFRKDPVFILGQSFGMIVYVRNMQMIRRPAQK